MQVRLGRGSAGGDRLPDERKRSWLRWTRKESGEVGWLAGWLVRGRRGVDRRRKRTRERERDGGWSRRVGSKGRGKNEKREGRTRYKMKWRRARRRWRRNRSRAKVREREREDWEKGVGVKKGEKRSDQEKIRERGCLLIM